MLIVLCVKQIIFEKYTNKIDCFFLAIKVIKKKINVYFLIVKNTKKKNIIDFLIKSQIIRKMYHKAFGKFFIK